MFKSGPLQVRVFHLCFLVKDMPNFIFFPVLFIFHPLITFFLYIRMKMPLQNLTLTVNLVIKGKHSISSLMKLLN